MILQLLFIAFALNLVYELCHSVLYKTCLEMPLKEYVPLMLKASAIDAAWIGTIYLIAGQNIVLFSVIAIAWAWAWEFFSLKLGRWEYSVQMPRIFGVGLTPLLQLFITGTASLFLAQTY